MNGDDKKARRAFLAMILGIVVILVLNTLYTAWAISEHSRQACAELGILATAKGAATTYDQDVKQQYERLYRLRCG